MRTLKVYATKKEKWRKLFVDMTACQHSVVKVRWKVVTDAT